MTDIATDKSALRSLLRQRRNAFVAQMAPLEKRLCFSVIPRPLRTLFDKATIIGSYHPTSSEVTTENYHKLFCDIDKIISLPWFSDRQTSMTFRQWSTSNALEQGPFDVMQPSRHAPELSPDLLIVPMLGFDDQGQRLGQGGGHYDRYFAANPEAMRIGLAWSVQQHDSIPVEKHDMPLDLVITQEGVITPATSRLSGDTVTAI
ncbi:MAG: 5-formyltetrahydrofolate cyclo-ligase [Pseudomonadota bacterium]